MLCDEKGVFGNHCDSHSPYALIEIDFFEGATLFQVRTLCHSLEVEVVQFKRVHFLYIKYNNCVQCICTSLIQRVTKMYVHACTRGGGHILTWKHAVCGHTSTL